jgi:hypothetical protein
LEKKPALPSEEDESMSAQQAEEEKSRERLFTTAKAIQIIKGIPDLIINFRNSVIIIIIWIIISEIAGNSVFELLRSIFKLIIYPINWLLFKTKFELTGIPEVFIIFIPLMLLVSIGFLILISTED